MSREILNKSLIWGLVTGLIYVVLILIQNMLFANSIFGLMGVKFVCYLVILALFTMHALSIRKKNEGLITLQEAFGAIFVVILVAEIFYVVFNWVYVKYIDPQFIEKIGNATVAYMEKFNLPQEKIDDAVQQMEEGKAKQMKIGSQIQSYFFSVLMDSVFGIIIAAIIKKSKQVNFN